MENIERFKKVRYYGNDGELTPDQIRAIGFLEDDYQTLEERAYQCAYDISNDWVKDNPDWDDVQEAFKRGVEESKEYYQNHVWHDVDDKPELEKPIFIIKNGVYNKEPIKRYAVGVYGKRGNDHPIWVLKREVPCSDSFISKWCYLEDILPIE